MVDIYIKDFSFLTILNLGYLYPLNIITASIISLIYNYCMYQYNYIPGPPKAPYQAQINILEI